MIIRISNNLKNQNIFANGVELASIMGKDRKDGKRIITYPEDKRQYVHKFKNPILMTDNHRISKLNPTLRDTLFSLYSSPFRTVEYDGVSVSTNPSYINVWSPSIDTILFAKAIRKHLSKRGDFREAIEIGCGSGYLSKYLLKKNKQIKSMLISDLNPYATKCAMDNINDSRAVFYTGEGRNKLKGKKFDLIICNPPYIPRPDSIDDNPYEGISLLNHLVHEGQNYLNPRGVLIIDMSSICWKIIFNKKSKMNLRILEKMKVPLKVNNILNNKRWVNYLREKGLKKKYHDGYEYWHEINIIALEN